MHDAEPPPATAPDAFVRYVGAWVGRDAAVLGDVLAEDVEYTESHGPAYRGLAQVQRWFADWNTRGTVHSWEITHHLSTSEVHVCRWTFTNTYDGDTDTFEGATWFVLDTQGKISELHEFASTLPRHYPYD